MTSTQWNGLYALYAAFGYQVMDRDPASPAAGADGVQAGAGSA